MRIIIILLLLFTLDQSNAQDLIQRTRQGLAARDLGSPENIDYQYITKSKMTKLSPFAYSTQKKYRAVDGVDAVAMEVSSSAIRALLKKQNWEISIPVDEQRSFALRLYPVDITTPDYQLYDGNDVVQPSTRIATYRGVVSDDPSSMATMVVTADGLQIVISDDFGNYNLGQVNGTDQYSLTNDNDYGAMPFDCGVADNGDMRIDLPKGVKIQESNEKMGKCVKVWAELDYSSFQTLGGVAQAEAFILGAFSVVSTLYSQYNVPVEVSGVKVWTTQDPYGAASNVSTALARVRSTRPSFNGDLFHLVSVKNSNRFSGIAYLACRSGSVCKATTIGTSIPYAVSQTANFYRSFPSYSWTVAVLAHEMGHNMGAPHTHECAWGPNNNTTIDECVNQPNCGSHNPPIGNGQGTLMSYCHLTGNGINFNVGFGNEVGTHIKSEYDLVSSSLRSCSGNTTGGGNPTTPTCSDGLKNGNETGVDCGGSCAPCPTTPTCSDGVKNGNETGVDCGGSCAPCPTTPTCSDGVKNGNETGVDCGGSCAPCPTTPTCSDGVKNGNETGVDCGGSCAPCAPPPPTDPYPCSSSRPISSPWATSFEGTLSRFSQGTNDNMDWSKGSGSTPSSSTGPSGAADGRSYMYMESSRPNYPNKTAVLRSECLRISGLSQPTLSFSYHMYGSNIGKLEVQAIDPSTNNGVVLWSKSGNQGNQWERVDIDLSGLGGSPFIIVFKGTTASSWRGDIAIDHVNIASKSSNPPTPTCSDGIKNGNETGVDCGGSCSPCPTTPTCSDGIKNGNETGVDCGGSCSPCPTTPTCSDGIKNGSETGVDCGGSCAPCQSADKYQCNSPSSISTAWANTFEGGLDNFRQSSDDDIDWSTGSGSTPSSRTGPSSASQGSGYLYIESSRPNYPSKKAILQSPCLDISGLANKKLTFDYHMYGANMGTLEILHVDPVSDVERVIWSESGDKGNSWLSANIDLSPYASSPFIILVRATTGRSWRGDMAIDDLRIGQGSTGGGNPTTPTCSDGIKNGNETGVDCGGSCAPCGGNPGGGSCSNPTHITTTWSSSFESDLGGFNQSSSDNADWERGSGSTPSRSTGPSSASQGSGYLFVESSRPNYPNKTAVLESSCLDVSGLTRPMLTLDYHMYGATMGTLDVIIVETSGRENKLVSISGNQGNQWRTVGIDLSAFRSSSIKIKIVGTTGSSWRSDIAIDHVQIANASSTSSNTTAYLDDCSQQTLIIDEDTFYDVSSSEQTSDRISLDSKVGVTAKLKLQGARGIEVKGEVEIKEGAELIISTENCKKE